MASKFEYMEDGTVSLWITCTGFSWAGCRSCPTTTSVEALSKNTQSLTPADHSDTHPFTSADHLFTTHCISFTTEARHSDALSHASTLDYYVPPSCSSGGHTAML